MMQHSVIQQINIAAFKRVEREKKKKKESVFSKLHKVEITYLLCTTVTWINYEKAAKNNNNNNNNNRKLFNIY